jgi:hypothetical protein
MPADNRARASELRRRSTRAQIFAGLGMGICVVVLMAIVMGRVGA